MLLWLVPVHCPAFCLFDFVLRRNTCKDIAFHAKQHKLTVLVTYTTVSALIYGCMERRWVRKEKEGRREKGKDQHKLLKANAFSELSLIMISTKLLK